MDTLTITIKLPTVERSDQLLVETSDIIHRVAESVSRCAGKLPTVVTDRNQIERVTLEWR
jgi:hypothetical protein